jgi:hypothetical protein
MWAALDIGYWLCLLLAVPAAGFLVRLFMIQHDCGHGAFFHRRATNDWVGRAIGVLTLTPYDFWRRKHAIHHSTSGNLERRGIGDIDTLTVHEYLSRSRWGRLCYRVYRHPLVMFGIGPAFLFLLQHRLPFGLLRGGWGPWLSTMGTNLAIAAVAAGLVPFCTASDGGGSIRYPAGLTGLVGVKPQRDRVPLADARVEKSVRKGIANTFQIVSLAHCGSDYRHARVVHDGTRAVQRQSIGRAGPLRLLAGRQQKHHQAEQQDHADDCNA